ncbi:MAG: 3-phosphoshikimate 1-carboxyvinyltransferase, partial [Clostridia bacterium]|nr:3-phosphoshikimate 1-carboxyvinyltransferase [Clostridia bacterium]
MTVDALKIFGAEPEKTEYGYYIRSNAELCSPDELFVEGDWSNAAFPLCMGAIGSGTVCVCGLNTASYQGDIAILDILREFGASVTVGKTDVTVSGGKRLTGIRIDASQIPDLVPVIATVASVADGESVIYGASRLRLKESDRLASVSSMLTSLGAQIKVTDDGLIINGKPQLDGGEVSSFNDHRIAMSAAVASVACSSSVTVCDFECTSKSYPDFLTDIKSLFN